MLQYERVNVFEGMDFGKTNKSAECMICQRSKILDLNINHMFLINVMTFNDCSKFR